MNSEKFSLYAFLDCDPGEYVETENYVKINRQNEKCKKNKFPKAIDNGSVLKYL